jgi:hypothetical protein
MSFGFMLLRGSFRRGVCKWGRKPHVRRPHPFAPRKDAPPVGVVCIVKAIHTNGVLIAVKCHAKNLSRISDGEHLTLLL